MKSGPCQLDEAPNSTRRPLTITRINAPIEPNPPPRSASRQPSDTDLLDRNLDRVGKLPVDVHFHVHGSCAAQRQR